jgi:Lon protease-like protein
MAWMELVELPLFPLGSVLFPGFAVQLHVFEDRYKTMIADCLAGAERFGIVGIERGIEVGGDAVPYRVGTLARITQLERLPGGRFFLVAAGLERFEVLEFDPDGKPYLRARVRLWPDDRAPAPDPATAAQAGALLNEYLGELVAATGNQAEDWGLRLPLPLPDDAGLLSLLIAALVQVPLPAKQALLAAPAPAARLALEIDYIARELALMRSTQAAPTGNAATLRGSFSDN